MTVPLLMIFAGVSQIPLCTLLGAEHSASYQNGEKNRKRGIGYLTISLLFCYTERTGKWLISI